MKHNIGIYFIIAISFIECMKGVDISKDGAEVSKHLEEEKKESTVTDQQTIQADSSMKRLESSLLQKKPTQRHQVQNEETRSDQSECHMSNIFQRYKTPKSHPASTSVPRYQRKNSVLSNVSSTPSPGETSSASHSLLKNEKIMTLSELDSPSLSPLLTSDVVDTASTTPVLIDPWLETTTAPLIISQQKSQEATDKVVSELETQEEENMTESKQADPLSPPPTSTEEISTFNHWAQIKLAELEKKGESSQGTKTPLPSGGIKQSTPTNSVQQRPTDRPQKNYASFECGAKISSSNPEAQSSMGVLNEYKDEYMLNPCSAKIWFIVELCDAIQIRRFDIANFELFSSSPRQFSLYSSLQHPAAARGEWTSLGTFEALDDRMVQSFALTQNSFAKFIKVEMENHYGSEHYCPVSLVRVFGPTEYEVLENEDSADNIPMTVNSENEGNGDRLDLTSPMISNDQNEPKNLFGSAKDAVLSIVKKAAASVLGRDSPSTNVGTNATKLTCNDPSLSLLSVNPSWLLGCSLCNPNLGSHSTLAPSMCRFALLSFGQALFEHVCSILVANKYNFTAIVPPSSAATTLPPTTPSTSSLSDPVLTTPSSVVADQKTQVPTSSKSEVLLTSTLTVTPSIQLDDSVRLSIQPTKTAKRVEAPPPNEDEKKKDTPATITATVSTTEIPPVTTSQVESSRVDSSQPTTESTAATKNQGSSDLPSGQTPLTPSPSPPSGSSPPSGIPSGASSQKESVFVRLNNKIRALEMNLSLSSQYLEELSQRYKRQMEEMQRAFNKTIGALNETARRANERDLVQQEVIGVLESKVNNLSSHIEYLMTERETFHIQLLKHHLWMMLLELAVTVTLVVLCWRRLIRSFNPSSSVSLQSQSVTNTNTEVVTLTSIPQTVLVDGRVETTSHVGANNGESSTSDNKQSNYKKRKRKKHLAVNSAAEMEFPQGVGSPKKPNSNNRQQQLSNAAGLLFSADKQHPKRRSVDNDSSNKTGAKENGNATAVRTNIKQQGLTRKNSSVFRKFMQNLGGSR